MTFDNLCETCNGIGLVGNMTREGGESWPCPDCGDETAEQAIERISRSMDRKIANLGNSDTSDIDARMLLKAQDAIVAIHKRSTKERKMTPIPEDTDLILSQMQTYNDAAMQALRDARTNPVGSLGRDVALSRLAQARRDWVTSSGSYLNPAQEAESAHYLAKAARAPVVSCL